MKLNKVIEELERLDDVWFEHLEKVDPKSHKSLAESVLQCQKDLRLLVKKLKLVEEVCS